MTKWIASILATIFIILAGPAHAQSRTWVSGVGDDLNPCSRTAPCKTFAGALTKTSGGGEINVIDPGGFGTVNITKSITIDGYGPMSSILASNTNGIIVNGAGITVTIRNITINAANTTLGNGIRIINAAAVNIENVVIENLAGTGTAGKGIVIDTSAAGVKVNVKNSKFYNINNFAIHSNPTGGNVILWTNYLDIDKGGTTAIQLRQFTTASINHTSITGHLAGAAVAAELSTVTTHISNSFFANNNFGVSNGNGGNPATRIYGTVITGSATAGLLISSGTVTSYGNNGIRGNNGNEAPSANSNTQ
jgi:hypothetical protein